MYSNLAMKLTPIYKEMQNIISATIFIASLGKAKLSILFVIEIMIAEKKLRRFIYDVLEEAMNEFKYRQPIRKLHHKYRHRRIKPLSLQILAAAINIDHFKDGSFDYLQEEKKDIATDIGYILSIIAKIISK